MSIDNESANTETGAANGDGADLFVTAPPQARPQSVRARREPLHFVVIVLLCTDIVFGLGLAVFAEKVIAFRPMSVMGLGLAVLGLGILAYFVLVGDKAKR